MHLPAGPKTSHWTISIIAYIVYNQNLNSEEADEQGWAEMHPLCCLAFQVQESGWQPLTAALGKCSLKGTGLLLTAG